ncbi:MAG TPA: helix-turn-helix transcriptional regulator [Puia sp.]
MERIHIAINEKWCKKGCGSVDASAEKAEKIDQRLQALEKQNDQLLYFVNFIVENLPDLVMNILEVEWKERGKPGAFPASKFAVGPQPTRREQEVLELLVKGLCAKEIAEKLFISETTVITHKKNLKDKFNARNTVELISKAQSYLPGEK